MFFNRSQHVYKKRTQFSIANLRVAQVLKTSICLCSQLSAKQERLENFVRGALETAEEVGFLWFFIPSLIHNTSNTGVFLTC